MNLFGFVHLGMAVVSTQGSARSGPGIPLSKQAQSCLDDRSDAGRKRARPGQRIARRPLRVQHAHQVDLTVFQFQWLPADPR